MKQQNQSFFNLMKFSFLPTEVESNIESFFDCVLKGWCRGWRVVNPQCCNAHCRGMPTELARCADVRFIQRLLKEDIDGEVRAGHGQQHRDLDVYMQ